MVRARRRSQGVPSACSASVDNDAALPIALAGRDGYDDSDDEDRESGKEIDCAVGKVYACSGGAVRPKKCATWSTVARAAHTGQANSRCFSEGVLMPRRGASRSVGEPRYDLLENELNEHREEDDARRESATVLPASSNAEDAREWRTGLRQCQVQLESFAESAAPVSGWLYIQVATRTTVEPRTKVTVMWKLKRATEARKEMTMLSDVAKPLRMLSAYLITSAVNKPPSTCTATVAHAQMPKFANREKLKGADDVDWVKSGRSAGRSAGRSENSESWTFRTHRSA